MFFLLLSSSIWKYYSYDQSQFHFLTTYTSVYYSGRLLIRRLTLQESIIRLMDLYEHLETWSLKMLANDNLSSSIWRIYYFSYISLHPFLISSLLTYALFYASQPLCTDITKNRPWYRDSCLYYIVHLPCYVSR